MAPKSCKAHLYLQRSHLGLFFKLFEFLHRAFAECAKIFGDLKLLYRELDSLAFFKVYCMERLEDTTFIDTFDGFGCAHIFSLGIIYSLKPNIYNLLGDITGHAST
jgi:hypothetical protein